MNGNDIDTARARAALAELTDFAIMRAHTKLKTSHTVRACEGIETEEFMREWAIQEPRRFTRQDGAK